jgi:hypothetical protein
MEANTGCMTTRKVEALGGAGVGGGAVAWQRHAHRSAQPWHP